MAPTRRQSSKGSSSDQSGQKVKTAATVPQDKDQWVCLLHDEIIKINPDGGEKQPSICKLKHPRTKSETLYLLSADDSMIFQMFNFKDKYRSWFIGNRVHSDGSLYLTTPMDPLFLILPYLMESKEGNKFMTLDQVVCDENFSDCTKLLSACNPEQVSLICDSKDIDDDIKVFRYNKEKTLSWLKAKTEALADSLEKKNVQVSSKSSHSSMFVHSKTAAVSRESLIEYAHGMVSDFLCPSLEEELKNYLNITDVKNDSQDSQVENEPPSKKAKITGDIAPTEDYSVGVDLKKGKKNTKLSAAQKQLSKVDKTGMKSISSFFSPKPQKT